MGKIRIRIYDVQVYYFMVVFGAFYGEFLDSVYFK